MTGLMFAWILVITGWVMAITLLITVFRLWLKERRDERE